MPEIVNLRALFMSNWPIGILPANTVKAAEPLEDFALIRPIPDSRWERLRQYLVSTHLTFSIFSWSIRCGLFFAQVDEWTLRSAQLFDFCHDGSARAGTKPFFTLSTKRSPRLLSPHQDFGNSFPALDVFAESEPLQPTSSGARRDAGVPISSSV
jgi:hypothetical protein